MAKSSHTIQMEYSKAIDQAEKLENMAKELRTIANQNLEEFLVKTNNAWKSDSSGKYIRKGRKLKEEILARAGEIDKAASAIRTIAKNVRNAEMKALQLAKQRHY